MSARATWKACHRDNRRWRNYTCHNCGGRCAAHHALYPIGLPYTPGTLEYACPCGGLTLFDTKERETVAQRGTW